MMLSAIEIAGGWFAVYLLLLLILALIWP